MQHIPSSFSSRGVFAQGSPFTRNVGSEYIVVLVREAGTVYAVRSLVAVIAS